MRGRPSKYKDEFVEQARKLCKLGATDADMSDFFGIDICNLNVWKLKHPEFGRALKDAKSVADQRVVRSLYQRAVGYEHDEVDIRVVGTEVVQTPLRKRYAPDTTACIFWLKNRMRDEWKDRTEHEVAGKGGGAVLLQISKADESL
jgi:hypothetical protein